MLLTPSRVVVTLEFDYDLFYDVWGPPYYYLELGSVRLWVGSRSYRKTISLIIAVGKVVLHRFWDRSYTAGIRTK